MTIEQAIEQYDGYANVCKYHDLTESQKEFQQIAAWLRELQERRKAPEIIRCKDCAKRHKYNCPFPFGMWDTTPADGYCYIAKRRTDG